MQFVKNSRQEAATNLNSKSSRSHCIYQFKVEAFKINQQNNLKKDNKIIGILNLIDLAGSENSKHSGVSGLNM